MKLVKHADGVDVDSIFCRDPRAQVVLLGVLYKHVSSPSLFTCQLLLSPIQDVHGLTGTSDSHAVSVEGDGGAINTHCCSKLTVVERGTALWVSKAPNSTILMKGHTYSLAQSTSLLQRQRCYKELRRRYHHHDQNSRISTKEGRVSWQPIGQ